ncbi:hypothetical protein C7999DRAFT_35839 [Corynascus novoguineensis]|uniref:AT hook domain-containing protein n=1 Tax=Corynascus novoguineensis TaxID=1126955 RepID=A0AAN7CM52_9PEZI|nr:hypothetical protein C7999DRAFT_35839 [Corynascus novoguineensis]
MASTPPPPPSTEAAPKRKRGRPPLSPSQRKPKPAPTGRPRGRPKGSGTKNKTTPLTAPAGVQKTASADPTAAGVPPRRGRGRPRKDGSAPYFSSVSAVKKEEERLLDAAARQPDAGVATPTGQVKRGRGRPKGSGKKQKLMRAQAEAAAAATAAAADSPPPATTASSGVKRTGPTMPARGGPGRGRRSVGSLAGGEGAVQDEEEDDDEDEAEGEEDEEKDE